MYDLLCLVDAPRGEQGERGTHGVTQTDARNVAVVAGPRRRLLCCRGGFLFVVGDNESEPREYVAVTPSHPDTDAAKPAHLVQGTHNLGEDQVKESAYCGNSMARVAPSSRVVVVCGRASRAVRLWEPGCARRARRDRPRAAAVERGTTTAGELRVRAGVAPAVVAERAAVAEALVADVADEVHAVLLAAPA